MNEAQKNLAACYKDLAMRRAAFDVALHGVKAACLEYGIDEGALSILDELARRTVMKELPRLVAGLRSDPPPA